VRALARGPAASRGSSEALVFLTGATGASKVAREKSILLT
jgi:hypothetical protein